jgi:hypothetical protein
MAAGNLISVTGGTASIWFKGVLMSSPSQNPGCLDRWTNLSQPPSDAGKGFTARNTAQPVAATDAGRRIVRRLHELQQKNALTRSDVARPTSISLLILQVVALQPRNTLFNPFRDI